MLRNKKLPSVFAVSAALAAASPILDRPASADVSQCSAMPGLLRFFDFETGHCGYVAGNNPNWGVFGSGRRADQFANDGPQNVCLYAGPRCSGAHVLLPVGFMIDWTSGDWTSGVGSNLWVDGTSCPASC